ISIRSWVLPAAALGVVLAAGCGRYAPPPPADPAAARQALRSALDAWQGGDTVEALARGKPPVHVADDDWQGGARLLNYEITGEGEMLGLNLCCPVALSLQDRGGRTVQKKVRYSVGTSPVLTIFREDRVKDS